MTKGADDEMVFSGQNVISKKCGHWFSQIVAMTAECSKWKFKKGTFFPEKLVCWKEDGEKIDPFYSFLKNGQHI